MKLGIVIVLAIWLRHARCVNDPILGIEVVAGESTTTSPASAPIRMRGLQIARLQSPSSIQGAPPLSVVMR